MVLDQLAPASALWQEKFKGKVHLGRIGDERVLLLKPQTFMNLSGESVRAALDFYKVDRKELLVVHDELDLTFGHVKLKLGGGEAGHNGLRSVSKHLGTKDYYRLRVGVGRPPSDFSGSPADFVLQAFAPDEQSGVDDLIERSVRAAWSFVEDGPQAAMNEVNRRR
jgi:PTH1 family peptidyl-tRNA hydrolase